MWNLLDGWTQEEIFLQSELTVLDMLPEKQGDLDREVLNQIDDVVESIWSVL